MEKLERKILNWIEDPKKFSKNPVFFTTNFFPEKMPTAHLNLRTLKCIKKNELSKDEITIYMFWLCERSNEVCVEGIIHTGHDFSAAGEVVDLNINVPLNRENASDTFCVLIYEVDMPALLDFHDPIGLASFHQNQGIAVYDGDFRKVEIPRVYSFQYDSMAEVDFDAGLDGNYKLSINIKKDNK